MKASDIMTREVKTASESDNCDVAVRIIPYLVAILVAMLGIHV